MRPNRPAIRYQATGTGAPNGLIPESDLPDVLVFRNSVKSTGEKYFALSEAKISRMYQPIPARSEGRFAIVTNGGPAMRWTLHAQARMRGRVGRKRTAKSCGPDLPTLRSSLPEMTGRRGSLSSPALRGEHDAAVKTIAQGMPDVSAYPRFLTRVLSTLVREAAGAKSARHSLRPLVFEGGD